jgi:hypothetical protein
LLKSFIHLDLNFVQGNKNGSICILLQANWQLSQHHLLKMLSFFPLQADFVVTLLKNKKKNLDFWAPTDT